MTLTAVTTHTRAQQQIYWDLISAVSCLRLHVGFIMISIFKILMDKEEKPKAFIFYTFISRMQSYVDISSHLS